jgi:hypothetical protein
MSHRITRVVLATAGLALAAAMSYGVVNSQVVKAEEVIVIKEGQHPRIHAALNALREARTELKEARHDFGGHREESLKAVDRAIEQLEIAAKYR